jgi:hypothetical protein
MHPTIVDSPWEQRALLSVAAQHELQKLTDSIEAANSANDAVYSEAQRIIYAPQTLQEKLPLPPVSPLVKQPAISEITSVLQQERALIETLNRDIENLLAD